MRYFENLIYFTSKLFSNRLAMKNGMVRYSLYRGGRMLIFASDKFCVCGQEFRLYCFTNMICASMAVVGVKGRPLAE